MSTETTTVVAKTKETSVLMRMAERFGMEPKAFENVIRATVMPGNVSDAHFCAFLLVADAYELNPLTKQIYAFPAKGGGIVPIVSVDGWHFLANTHKQYDGMAQKIIRDPDLGLGIETTIWRKDRGHPMVHTEWLSECKRDTEPWKMQQRMLGHRSFVQTCRMAFSLSGIYDEDEALDIIDTTATVLPAAKKPSRLAQLEARIAPTEPTVAELGDPAFTLPTIVRTKPKPADKPLFDPKDPNVKAVREQMAQDESLLARTMAAEADETPSADEDPEGYNAVLEAAYEDGQLADSGIKCPHPKGSDIEAAWVAGYNSGHKDGLF